MPESKRRKPKRPKKTEGAQIKIKGGTKYLRMLDETGRKVWVPLPKDDKD